MKIVVQRVKSSSIEINKKIVSKINFGLLILLGISVNDDIGDVEWLVKKTLNLRIFDDSDGVMNKSLVEIGGEILIVSQFTLLALTKKGNRPSYINSAKHDLAVPLYEKFIKLTKDKLGTKVKTGVFGADMKISLVNDGPVTIIIDSKNKE
jgi:D-tyrosyl-tRNA(Tyr) deacylase